ncbi:MAG: DUF389 domain-containing protein [Terriglobia bacterium]
MPEPSIDSTISQTRLQVWLDIEERTKPGVYSQVFESAKISKLSYWLEIVFSAAIATFGLVLNSPAVIIGAMLISPLMGPIMATGLALAIGDLYLAIKAVANVAASVAVAVALSAFAVWALPFHSPTAEILARSNPNLLDLGVAVFSGLAGSMVICRGGGGGGVTALPGVAIAVALMPPLCTMGFGLGSGGNMEVMGGAGLLFVTNLVAIVSSAFLVFFLVGMNSHSVLSELKKFQEHDPLAKRLSHGFLGRAFSGGAQVRWRILILIVLLGSIAVPLRRALLQVAGETLARGAAESALKSLAPADTVVAKQIQIGRDEVAIRLISTRNVPEAAVQRAESAISARTGRAAHITVQAVASRSEVADLAAQLAAPAPAPAPPPVQTLDEIRQKVIARVGPAITRAWPAEVPLAGFDVAFDATGVICNVKYQAARDLDALPLSMVERGLRTELETDRISLHATREPIPKPVRGKNQR